LVDAGVYATTAAAATPSARAVRYVYETAVELDPDTATRWLEWQPADKTVQGHASRGTGVVMKGAAGVDLMSRALEAGSAHMKARAESVRQDHDAVAAAAAALRAE
jgi:hypothetical protein